MKTRHIVLIAFVTSLVTSIILIPALLSAIS